MRWMLLVAMLAVSTSVPAQPIFQRKQIAISQRPVPSATAAGDVTKASLVTMHFTNAPLREVLTEFGKQIDAGVVVEGSNDGFLQVPSLNWVETTKISVNIEQASYWDAVRELVKAIPTSLDPIGSEGSLRLVEHAAKGEHTGRQDVLYMSTAPGERRVGALLLAPIVLRRNFQGKDETRLVLAVVTEPRVWGVSGLGMLRLTQIAGSDGTSLLGQNHEFFSGTDGSWAGDYARWSFDLGDPPPNGVTVNTIRGDLRVGIEGDRTTKMLSLTSMFRPVALLPNEVQANELCQIFRAPAYGEARGTQTSPDRSFPDECKVMNARHVVPQGDELLEAERGHPVYTEERTLVLHNINKAPETFVITTTFRPDVALFTSDPKPLSVRDHGEYRVVVQPGQTVRLPIAYRVDQTRSRRTPPLTLEDVPLAPHKLWQTTTVGSTTLTVKAVVPKGGEYVVRGTYSSPADEIVAHACPTECGYVGLKDAEHRVILHYAAGGPVHREGKRSVVDWSATTASRGLVPATLTWSPGTTSWTQVPLP